MRKSIPMILAGLFAVFSCLHADEERPFGKSGKSVVIKLQREKNKVTATVSVPAKGLGGYARSSQDPQTDPGIPGPEDFSMDPGNVENPAAP